MTTHSINVALGRFLALTLVWLPLAVSAAQDTSRECVQLALADVAAAMPAAAAPMPRRAEAGAASAGAACWIEYDAAVAWAGQSPTWIDVRSSAFTRGQKLGGALEIALSDLPRKTFLQSQPIVLVGTGYDDVELGNACDVLQRAGFQRVKLLRGGVRAWQKAGLPVTGGAQLAADMMTPGEFHRAAANARWLVLGVDLPSGDALPAVLAGVRILEARGDAMRGAAAVAQAQADLARLPSASRPTLVVVVAASATGARVLREAVNRAQVADVAFVEGGLAGYRQFLTEQESIAAHAGKPLVRPCGTT